MTEQDIGDKNVEMTGERKANERENLDEINLFAADIPNSKGNEASNTSNNPSKADQIFDQSVTFAGLFGNAESDQQQFDENGQAKLAQAGIILDSNQGPTDQLLNCPVSPIGGSAAMNSDLMTAASMAHVLSNTRTGAGAGSHLTDAISQQQQFSAVAAAAAALAHHQPDITAYNNLLQRQHHYNGDLIDTDNNNNTNNNNNTTNTNKSSVNDSNLDMSETVVTGNGTSGAAKSSAAAAAAAAAAASMGSYFASIYNSVTAASNANTTGKSPAMSTNGKPLVPGQKRRGRTPGSTNANKMYKAQQAAAAAAAAGLGGLGGNANSLLLDSSTASLLDGTTAGSSVLLGGDGGLSLLGGAGAGGLNLTGGNDQSGVMNGSSMRDEHRRFSHNEVERKRRSRINQLINRLNESIPENDGSFVSISGRAGMGQGPNGNSKGKILERACNYIDLLHYEIDKLRTLISENSQLRQELDYYRRRCLQEDSKLNFSSMNTGNSHQAVQGNDEFSLNNVNDNILLTSLPQLNNILSGNGQVVAEDAGDMGDEQEELENEIHDKLKLDKDNSDDDKETSVQPKKNKVGRKRSVSNTKAVGA